MPLNFRGQAKEGHDLGDSGAGEIFAASDCGLVGYFAGIQEGFPPDGLLKEVFRARSMASSGGTAYGGF